MTGCFAPEPVIPVTSSFGQTRFPKTLDHGAWTDDAFDAAVRKGVRPNGARLYPAMPFNAYTKMSRDDVQAIRAYLNSVDPVRNAVVANSREVCA